ncbi:MAG: VOC family protein [Proteobacteria bacterium]|nr:VOC family protein [Pseudomonadota bacterium]
MHPLAQVRHAALCVADIDRSASFYGTLFGLTQTERGSTPRADYCYFVDGERHLALLHYRSDAMAGVSNSGSFTGAHHFGLQVDDLRTAQQACEAGGGRFHFNLGDEQEGNFESKYRDPNGVIFDLSQGGWVGTPTQRVGIRLAGLPPSDCPGARLSRATIVVPDPALSAAFFTQALGFAPSGPVAGLERAEIDDGSFKLVFERSPRHAAVVGTERGTGFSGTHHLGFDVPDIDAFQARLATLGGVLLERSSNSTAARPEVVCADPEGTVFHVRG